jgi:transcriptional pleiotropic regulator of transition state genes
MQSTGVVRRVDGLGRIVLPVELRQLFGIRPGDDLEIWREDSAIAISKYTPVCLFCGGSDGLERYRGKWVCRECLGDLP